MEIFLSLGHCPEFGSPQDVSLRHALSVQRKRRLAEVQVRIQASLSSTGATEISSLQKAHKKYISAEWMLEDMDENTDKTLLEEYYKIQGKVAKASMDESGELVVRGVLDDV